MPGPRYSKEEFARLGEDQYQRSVLPYLKDSDKRKFVVDIESGAYEIDSSEIAASDRLWARISDPQPWVVKVGSRYTRLFGAAGRLLAERSPVL